MIKNTLMNIVTIVAYCMIFLYAVFVVTIGVMWAIGMFNEHTEPAAGLKFNVDQIVISENGGSASFRVLSQQATITGEGDEQVIEDPAVREEIRVEVWDDVGPIQSSNLIVSVTETGTLCDTVMTVTALLGEDGFNKGGICYLRAYTMDDRYYAERIPVYVDVPIQSVTMSAVDVHTGEVFDLDATSENYTKFVKGDQFNLNIDVYPTRAVNPFGLEVSENKVAQYFSSVDVDFVDVQRESDNRGLVSVNASNDRSGDVTLSVEIPRTYESGSDVASAEITINVALLELNQIVIQNTALAQMDYATTVTLFSDAPTLVSAVDTGDPSVVNLDLFLEPVYYNESTNQNPLADRVNAADLHMTYWSSYEETGNKPENMPQLLTIRPSDVENQNNVIWSITANRELEAGETVRLVLYYNQNDTRITAEITSTVTINVPETVRFVDPNTQNTLTNLNLTITKALQGSTEIVTTADNRDMTSASGGLLSMGDNTTGMSYTYDTIVFFVEGNNANGLQNITQTNVVNVTQYGQLLFTDTQGNLFYNTMLQPLGAGRVTITAYLVRTDSNGIPINSNYERITDLDTVTGVSVGGALTDYVLIREYGSLTVNVTERLTSLTVYTDPNLALDPLDSITEYPIGTTTNNEVTLYARGNSALALPSSTNSSDIDIDFNVTIQGDSLGGSTSSPYHVNIVDVNFTQYQNTQGEYYNLMSFTVFVTFDNIRTADAVKAEVYIGSGNNSYTSFKLSAREVKVDAVNISGNDITTDYVQLGTDNQYLNVKTLTLDSSLRKQGSEGNYYYRVSWADDYGHYALLPVTYTAESIDNFIISEQVPGTDQYVDKTLYPSGGPMTPSSVGYSIRAYFADNTDGNAIQRLNSIDRSKVSKVADSTNLVALFTDGTWVTSVDRVTLEDASNYVVSYYNTGTGRYQLQFKQELPADKVLIIMYMYDDSLEQIYNANSEFLTSIDYFVLEANFPTVEFEEVAPEMSILRAQYESEATVLDIGTTSNWGTVYVGSGVGLVDQDGNQIATGDMSEGLSFSMTNSADTYFSLEFSDGKYTLKLRSGYEILTEIPTTGNRVQQNLIDFSLNRSIHIVLDLEDNVTPVYHYYITNSIEISLFELVSVENTCPIFRYA